MKKIKEIFLTRAGFALISNLITLIVSLLCFRVFWEENDDIGMALLTEGAYGYHEPHILYSNTIYGKILCVMQSIVPTVRWHAVLMYLFSFIALTVFVYVISKDKKGRILSALFLISVFYETYVSFQFSKVSVVIAAASYMTIFDLAKDKMQPKIKRRLYVLSMICMLYSVILRYESFLLATVLAGLFGIVIFIRECKSESASSTIKKYCTYFVPVFAVFLICFGINRYTYSSKEWKEYTDYFSAVEQIADYHYNSLLYDLHGDDLASLGVSKNDAYMLITYQGSNPKFLTTDLMYSISRLDTSGISKIDVDFIKAWIANIRSDLLNVNNASFAGLLMITGMILAALYKSSNKTDVASILALLAVASFAILFYYQYSGRWSHRIVYALILSLTIVTVYILSDIKKAEYDALTIGCILAVLFLCVINSRLDNEFAYQEYKRSSYDIDEMISYMEDNKDMLFVGDVFTMNDYARYDVFTPARADQYGNYLSTDSVYLMGTPVNESIAAKFGYTDPFSALSSRNEKVILIDSVSPEVELTYCNEHGDGAKYALEEIDPVGNINLYKIK